MERNQIDNFNNGVPSLNMTKKELQISIGVFLIAAILIGVYLYLENEKKTNKIKELEEDNLKLILDSLKQNKNFSEEVKGQIEKLIVNFKAIDNRISNELAQALQLLQIGQAENAIEDLVKIIEHLLTTYYKDHQACNDWLKAEKKRFDLHNLLTFCKFEEKIDDVEYRFFLAIKTIRNKEDHEVDFVLPSYLTESGLLTAIGGIFKIASIVYPNEYAA